MMWLCLLVGSWWVRRRGWALRRLGRRQSQSKLFWEAPRMWPSPRTTPSCSTGKAPNRPSRSALKSSTNRSNKPRAPTIRRSSRRGWLSCQVVWVWLRSEEALRWKLARSRIGLQMLSAPQRLLSPRVLWLAVELLCSMPLEILTSWRRTKICLKARELVSTSCRTPSESQRRSSPRTPASRASSSQVLYSLIQLNCWSKPTRTSGSTPRPASTSTWRRMVSLTQPKWWGLRLSTRPQWRASWWPPSAWSLTRRRRRRIDWGWSYSCKYFRSLTRAIWN